MNDLPSSLLTAEGRTWETTWVPYDEPTYRAVLEALEPQDVVLDIGAGDLRLALRMARRVQHVTAIELHAELLRRASDGGRTPLPPNLHPICGDARQLPFPRGITTAVLLMRHCQSFRHYYHKLSAIGCHKLITNARWGMGVEVINLQKPRLPFQELAMGWYACLCGATGFVPGPASQLDLTLLEHTYEVKGCPHCASTSKNKESVQ